MLTQLKKMYLASFSTFWQMCAIYTGIWAAMFTLFGILMAVKPKNYQGIAGLLCVVFGTLFLIMVFVMSYSIEFEQAVKMSIPRKTYLTLYSLINLSLCVILAAFVIMIMQLDIFLARLIFNVTVASPAAAFGTDGIMPILKLFGVLILANVVAMVMGIFIGALLQRFGKAAFWAIWCLYMIFAFCGMGFGMISKNPNNLMGRIFHTIGSFFSTLTPTGIGILGAIIALLAAVIGVILLRKAPVKS